MSCLRPAGELMMSQLEQARKAKLRVKVCQMSALGKCERDDTKLGLLTENPFGWRFRCVNFSAELSQIHSGPAPDH